MADPFAALRHELAVANRILANEGIIDAFGHIIENHHLLLVLEERAKNLPGLTRVEDATDAVESDPERVTIRFKGGGHITVRLLIGADGRRSQCRAAAGIEVDSHSYPQTALTFNLRHARPLHLGQHWHEAVHLAVEGQRLGQFPGHGAPLLANRAGSEIPQATGEEEQRVDGHANP